MRDYALGATFDVKFTSRNFTTGSPFVLAGSPVVSAYPDNSVSQITGGITLSIDFDAVTGLNNIRVVATSGNGYASGSNYALVLTAGTVNGVSVVGEVVGEFSLEAQSGLRPTVAGRTLDVSAAGEAGLDWANIGSPTTTQNLSGTTTSGSDPWATAIPGAYGAGTAGKIVGDNLNATVGSRATQTSVDTVDDLLDTELPALTTAVGDLPTNAELATALGTADDAILAQIAFVKTKTDQLVFTVANRVDASSESGGVALTSTERNAIADALLNRDMATGTDSGSTSVRTVRQALRFLRNKWSVSGTTLTVCKEDDVTTTWTSILSTTPGADPVTATDPAGP